MNKCIIYGVYYEYLEGLTRLDKNSAILNTSKKGPYMRDAPQRARNIRSQVTYLEIGKEIFKYKKLEVTVT